MLPSMLSFSFSYLNNHKQAMNIGKDQIRGALFNFFVVKKSTFVLSSGHWPQFLKQPMEKFIMTKKVK